MTEFPVTRTLDARASAHLGHGAMLASLRVMNVDPELLDDEALLEQCLVTVDRIVKCKVYLIRLIAAVDRRGSYRKRACTSTRDFCEKVLKFTRAKAEKRVRVARLSQRVKVVLRYLAAPPEQGIHLSGLVALAPCLTPENAGYLLPRSVNRTTSQIEALVADYKAARDPRQRPADTVSPQTVAAAAAPITRTICFTATPALQLDLDRARGRLADENADVSSIVEWALRTALAATEDQPVVEQPVSTTATLPEVLEADAVDCCVECARTFAPGQDDHSETPPQPEQSAPTSGDLEVTPDVVDAPPDRAATPTDATPARDPATPAQGLAAEVTSRSSPRLPAKRTAGHSAPPADVDRSDTG